MKKRKTNLDREIECAENWIANYAPRRAEREYKLLQPHLITKEDLEEYGQRGRDVGPSARLAREAGGTVTDHINFILSRSDGVHCCQVLIYSDLDLNYWKHQAKDNGYLMAFDYHAPRDGLGYDDPEHDVYQIFPPEQKEKFSRLKTIEL